MRNSQSCIFEINRVKSPSFFIDKSLVWSRKREEVLKLKNDEYLKNYKPKDDPFHYEKCKKCGGHDLSFVLLEFGICLKCWEKFKRKISRDLHIPLGRMLLFYSKNRQTILNSG